MRPVFTSNARAFLLSVAAATLLTTSVYADCTYELFNIASVKGTSVGDFIDQISDECGMSVIVTDEEAENILKKQMNKTYLKNLTINEVLDLIVKENNLQYTLQNNVLKIAYLTTKTYQIDYISGERKGEGSTNIRLSSNTGSSTGSAGGTAQASGTTGTGGAQSGTTSNSSESGTNISSKDEVKFWSDLDNEIKSILNRPEDSYRQNNALDQNSSDVHHIYINKSAGMVTVSATNKQLQRLDKYIADLQKKMQTQVLIDVKIYSVEFKDGSSTGIDWSQLYALQNIDMTFDYQNTNKVTTYSSTALNTGTAFSTFPLTTDGNNVGSIFRLGAKGSLKEVIKFLKTQGDVQAVSNPKILTLNNQQALITSGTELFYKTKSSSAASSGGGAAIGGETEVISSVFAGVLLDITPEISNDGSITLRINPSISDVASQLATDNATRSMPPDLSRRQMSSVVTVQDGNTIIMGGLIGTKNDMTGNKIPLLGDIPVLGWLFKSEGVTKKTEEMVIIIQPHIVKRDGSNVSLSDLGYSRMGASMEKDEMARNALLKQSDKELKELKELTKNSK